MKITCLGTGSPESHKRRASSGYLVEVGGDSILLDCGGGVVDRLIQSDRMPSDVTHVFFTHLHSDHMMDYARLVHAAWDEAGTCPEVWGPEPIGEITERLFGKKGVFAADLVARTEFPGSQEVWLGRGGSLPRPWPNPKVTEIAPGFAFSTGNWSLTTCFVPHVQPYLVSLAIRIEANGKSVVYSGDAGLCPQMEELARNADLLLHWCYRLSHERHYPCVTSLSPSPDEISRMAERIGVKQLVLTHLRKYMDSVGNHELIRDELSRYFSGRSQIAEDLMVFDLEGG
ncbi:MAG: MBL fold metallo-hydrolase [Gammaproteobacteria bacterium]|nr:MBL fold metallo-hydrolase [Gammaproteobacteria bacterium]MYD76401.1 MBL fold metallo-hydrolase [Gammaproteobacteria bacterium]MYJ52090.1 MBL fold metallo-hydrolase [Gammaproteobacteria bacterium]